MGVPSPGTHKVRKVILLPVVSRENCEDRQYKGVLGRPLGKENKDRKERNDEAKRIFYSWRQRGRRQDALGKDHTKQCLPLLPKVKPPDACFCSHYTAT